MLPSPPRFLLVNTWKECSDTPLTCTSLKSALASRVPANASRRVVSESDALLPLTNSGVVLGRLTLGLATFRHH